MVLPLPGRPSSVLFVHAHPDDETLSTGGLIALLVDAGVAVTVVTATRGERGMVVPGPLADLEGTGELAAHREGELTRALDALTGSAAPGIRRVFLGEAPARRAGAPDRHYVDSGMVWGDDGLAAPAPDAGPTSLTAVPLRGLAVDLAAACAAVRPEVVVGYGPLGGYGHPDHLRVRHLARAVAVWARLPYLAVLSEIELERLTPAARGRVVTVDARPVADRVRAALGAHASQLTVLDGPPDADPTGAGTTVPDAPAAPWDGPAPEAVRVRHSGGEIQVRSLLEHYLPDTASLHRAGVGPMATHRPSPARG